MPTTWLPPRGWRVSRPAWAAASAVRRAYAAALPQVVRRPVPVSGELRCDVVTFSGQRDLPEQVASLRALLRRAGRPASVTVVSDGTHRPASVRLLEAVDERVRVVDWRDVAPADLPPAARRYAAASPMGRKLAVEVALLAERPPGSPPVVYVDSDVLLLAAGGELRDVLGRPVPGYLLDPEDVYLDPRLLLPGELVEPLNAGFLLLPGGVDWAPALDRLDRLDGEPGFHTEQTLVHLTVRAAGGRPLDPARWVVATDDMPDLGDRHRSARTVLRHYTSPVRHKFWLAVAADTTAASLSSRSAPA